MSDLARASIQTRRRADGTTAYRVMFRINGRLVGETFDTHDAAATFVGWVARYGGEQARRLRDFRDNGDGQHQAAPTVAAWAHEHIDRLSGITTGTRNRYRAMVDRTLDHTSLGQLPVDLVTPAHVAAWVRDQEAAGLSGKTIRNRHGLLFAAMASAVEEGLRASNPCRRTGIAQTERGAMTFLTHGEFAVLLTHMPTRWKPLTVTLAGTGLRFGEAAALQVGDVALDDTPATIRVERAWKYVDGRNRELGPPKTRKGRRTVSIPPSVVDVLRPLIEGRGAGEFVFTTATGRPVRNVDYREDGWIPALTKATAAPTAPRLTKRPRIHDLRHSHASWLIAAGVALPVIQTRLGHESIKTTVDVYGHLADDAQAVAAAATSIALAQALPELEPSGRD